jgi:hypothetical protein
MAFGPKAQKLLGRWRVTFDTGWSWDYTFLPGKAVIATDIKNPPEETWLGTWSFIGPSVKIRWRTSAEEWFLPLDGAMWVRGRSLAGQGWVSAERS